MRTPTGRVWLVPALATILVQWLSDWCGLLAWGSRAGVTLKSSESTFSLSSFASGGVVGSEQTRKAPGLNRGTCVAIVETIKAKVIVESWAYKFFQTLSSESSTEVTVELLFTTIVWPGRKTKRIERLRSASVIASISLNFPAISFNEVFS